RRGWRQFDVARRAGVSASTVSRVERGQLDEISVAALRRVTEALGAQLEIRCRWNGEGLDRLLDEAHAALVESFVERLQGESWQAAVEVSFSIRGERGSVDVLGFHAASRTLLIVEAKTVIPDAQAMLFSLDRKARLAGDIAAARGWTGEAVARLL